MKILINILGSILGNEKKCNGSCNILGNNIHNDGCNIHENNICNSGCCILGNNM